MTNHYEIVFIVPGAVEETGVGTVKDKVVQLLTAAQAQVTYEEDMGRRRLAYPIRQQTTGHYFVVQFDCASDALKQLEYQLQLDPDVLRHLITKTKLRTAEELQAMGQRRRQHQEAWQAEQATRAQAAQRQAEAEKVADLTVPERPDSKVSLEELDKKLDAILEDTDLEAKL